MQYHATLQVHCAYHVSSEANKIICALKGFAALAAGREFTLFAQQGQ